ncbi:unnamed protein product [Cuscuta epithymum]|uniref:Uncharacterized protein n=1 Tax=Cuscuta epithymum TaxID=186058 RepID=A0AAV0CP80_9ASTE|nr:unnamed protein product [Cuscuta epithymum]CAH9131698.1 unnamed protein product [Cuscuta epithymum]
MSSEQNIIVLVHWNGVLTNVDNEVKYSSFPNAVLFLNADVSYSTLCENVLSQISRDGLNEIKTIHGKFPFDTRDGVCASMPWPIHDEPSWIYFVQIASNVYDRLEVFIDATNRDVVIPLHEGPSRRRRNPMPSTLNQGPSMVHMEEESASNGSDDSHDSSWALPHSVCHFLNCRVDYLIPEVYKLSSYINAHSGDIMPFPNMNEWPQNEFILLLPKYSSRTSRAGRRQETRFPNEMDMRPRRRGQHD